MRDPSNIIDVLALRPDYMGFIFYKDSPRYVGEEFEMPVLPSSIQKVGVFVNEQTDQIVRKVSDYRLDLVQLHGNETVDQCKKLKDAGIEIVKAFSVDENFNFEAVDPYKNYVRFFLFDTKGKYYGGNASTFDWSLLRKYDQSVPFFLSGGISSENVKDTKQFSNLNIYALDVNSGVEVVPAFKDVQKIKQLQQTINAL